MFLKQTILINHFVGRTLLELYHFPPAFTLFLHISDFAALLSNLLLLSVSKIVTKHSKEVLQKYFSVGTSLTLV